MEHKRKLQPGHKKVRTGCITCRRVFGPHCALELKLTVGRIRRVKCDEQKPYCFRCTSTGRKCDGYQFDSVPDQDRLVHNISLLHPGTVRERRAFEFFRNYTGPEFFGYFTDEFWNRHVLQASFSHPALRHAVVAIGALHESYKRALQQGTTVIDSPDNFALRQYIQALSSLSKSFSSGGQQTDIALMSCIVFSCFDSLTGNIDAVATHLRSGLKILRYATPSDVNSYLRIFRRLSLQSIFFIDSSKEEKKLDFREMAMPDPCNDLPKFTSVDEARYSYDSILSTMQYFLTSTPVPGNTDAKRMLEIKDTQYRKNSATSSIPGMSKLDSQRSGRAFRFPYSKDKIELETSQHYFFSMLQSWSRKLDTFLLDSNLNLSTRDLQAAASLKISWLVCLVGTEGAITPGKFSSADFTAKFQKIVNLCRSLLAAQDASKPQFCVEFGIIGPLHFVGMNCQDLGIRRQVLELLSTPRREGMWDSQVIAFVLSRVMADIEGRKALSPDRNDSSTPQPLVTTAELSRRPLREVIDIAKKEMQMLGSREQKPRTNSIGPADRQDLIRWETLISLEPITERPYAL
jgi:Fungal specific transcription factor domain/Fungal Zn(2)-Cys(6) binuclear cluster domain